MLHGGYTREELTFWRSGETDGWEAKEARSETARNVLKGKHARCARLLEARSHPDAVDMCLCPRRVDHHHVSEPTGGPCGKTEQWIEGPDRDRSQNEMDNHSGQPSAAPFPCGTEDGSQLSVRGVGRLLMLARVKSVRIFLRTVEGCKGGVVVHLAAGEEWRPSDERAVIKSHLTDADTVKHVRRDHWIVDIGDDPRPEAPSDRIAEGVALDKPRGIRELQINTRRREVDLSELCVMSSMQRGRLTALVIGTGNVHGGKTREPATRCGQQHTHRSVDETIRVALAERFERENDGSQRLAQQRQNGVPAKPPSMLSRSTYYGVRQCALTFSV